MHPLGPSLRVQPGASASPNQPTHVAAPPKEDKAAAQLGEKPMRDMRASTKNFQFSATNFMNAVGEGNLRGAMLAAPVLLWTGLDVAVSAQAINAQLGRLGLAGLTQSLLASAATKQGAKPLDFDKLNDEESVKGANVSNLTKEQAAKITNYHLFYMKPDQLESLGSNITNVNSSALKTFLDYGMERLTTPQLKALKTAFEEPIVDETGKASYHPLNNTIDARLMVQLNELIAKREKS